MKEPAVQRAQGRTFQAEGPTSAKTWRLKEIVCLGGILYPFVVDLGALFKNNPLKYLSPIIHYTFQRNSIY